MFNKNKRARSLENNLTMCVYIFNPFCPEHVQKLLQLQILPKRMEQTYPEKIIETRDHVLFYFFWVDYITLSGAGLFQRYLEFAGAVGSRPHW
jgi:hypothetical protein